MCLIVFAYKYHPNYPLILAANRDEFYERATSKAQFWDDYPDLLAGKDNKYGGTWMGITTSGRFAAVTNFRDMTEFRKHPLSRGLMVKDYLTSLESPVKFLKRVIAMEEEYNGFNLLLGDPSDLYYYSNRNRKNRSLIPGVYGLSNHLLDTPWPKVVKSRKSLISILDNENTVDPENLFKILSDRTIAADQYLPDTGFGLEWERVLSPAFIETPTYGTMSSTVLIVDIEGHVRYEERSFKGPHSPRDISCIEFSITGH